jgi:hypothetical protein
VFNNSFIHSSVIPPSWSICGAIRAWDRVIQLVVFARDDWPKLRLSCPKKTVRGCPSRVRGGSRPNKLLQGGILGRTADSFDCRL